MDAYIDGNYIYVTREILDGSVHTIEIPIEALVSWQTLLELDSYDEALDYIVNEAILLHSGEGGYKWEKIFKSLLERDYFPDLEEVEAVTKGTSNDPRSPKLRRRIAEFKGRNSRTDTLNSVRHNKPEYPELSTLKNKIRKELGRTLNRNIKPRILKDINSIIDDMLNQELVSRQISEEDIATWKYMLKTSSPDMKKNLG